MARGDSLFGAGGNPYQAYVPGAAPYAEFLAGLKAQPGGGAPPAGTLPAYGGTFAPTPRAGGTGGGSVGAGTGTWPAFPVGGGSGGGGANTRDGGSTGGAPAYGGTGGTPSPYPGTPYTGDPAPGGGTANQGSGLPEDLKLMYTREFPQQYFTQWAGANWDPNSFQSRWVNSQYGRLWSAYLKASENQANLQWPDFLTGQVAQGLNAQFGALPSWQQGQNPGVFGAGRFVGL